MIRTTAQIAPGAMSQHIARELLKYGAARPRVNRPDRYIPPVSDDQWGQYWLNVRKVFPRLGSARIVAHHLKDIKKFRNIHFGRTLAWFAFHPDSPIERMRTGGFNFVNWGCYRDNIKFVHRIMDGSFSDEALVHRNAAQHLAENYILRRKHGVFYDIQTLRQLIIDNFVNTPNVYSIDVFLIDDLVEAQIHHDIHDDRGSARQRMADLLVHQAFGDLRPARINKLANILVRETDSPLYAVKLHFGMPHRNNNESVRTFLE